MAIEAETKAAVNAFKKHWIALVVVAIVLVALAFSYERKNPGKVTGPLSKLASLPIVGGLFA